MQTLVRLMQREIAIHMSRKGEWVTVLLFYIICSTLFPIALGSWSGTYILFAPIVIWVALVIGHVLAQESLLREDFKLGVFDLMFLNPRPLAILLLVKIIAHWLVYSVPLVLLTPIIGLSFGLSYVTVTTITCSILIGTIFLSLIAALGAALTIPLARGGTLVALLILPLYIPVLCIGSNIGILSVQGITSYAHFALLGAFTIIALMIVPTLLATAIKVSIE